MIHRKLVVLASLLVGFVNIALAGVGDLDTLNVRSQAPVKERMPVVAYKFNPKSLILPASLITVGAVGTAIDGMNDFHLFSRKDSVKQIHIDNYLEWGMLGWVFVCDLMGKEKHNWVDQLCLVALAEGMNGLMVHGLKNWVNEPRPDGAPYSFPSGHTATAFMTATMLNKEYGHKSPWIGIGAYSVATATGLMRMANNKHWLSDVLTGAGIGILSTELGYYLADLIFKERGINRLANEEVFSRMDKPSFLSLYLGLNIPLSGYDIDEQTEFSTSSGSTAGVEGAYFFNPYIGAGGRFTVSNTSIIVNTDRAENNTFDVISFYGGSYFSYPLSSRWMIGSKLLGGYVHYPLLQLADRPVTARNGFSFGSGVSLTFKAKAHYGIRFFLDYDLLPSHSKNSGEYMNMLTLGSSFMIAL